ncbi:MAG: acyl-ACP--UDP-N-acetylglucosamine O-acyltransferase [Microscillaceae bacterium]|jgi:UDP-N-acetylglucosamine acyltransferase|nr:acyl-ACP--UDP-N-acetylglucosamine O-acyltransferase [Microscillaceae bacterium]
MSISPLAYIHPGAKLAENVTVEPFAVIYDNVEIGEGTWIGPQATVMYGSRIGKNCKIHPNAVIGNVPQDLKFAGEESLAIIGDNTVIRECATVNRGTADKMQTLVGKNCLIMAYCHVAHDCVLEDNCILSNAVQLAGHVEVCFHATIGGGTVVHQFVRIGQHTMIQGGSKVTKDIPHFVLAGREPISYEGINIIGLRRRGFSNELITEIREIYKVLYDSGLNISQALEEIENKQPQSPERDLILEFVKGSSRGIVK